MKATTLLVIATTLAVVGCDHSMSGQSVRSGQSVSEIDASEQETALHAAAAIDLRNKAFHVGNADSPSSEQVLTLRRLALVEARKANTAIMNQHYSGFGDHFEKEFIRGLELTIEGTENSDNKSILEGQALLEKFGEWYTQNFAGIRGV